MYIPDSLTRGPIPDQPPAAARESAVPPTPATLRAASRRSARRFETSSPEKCDCCPAPAPPPRARGGACGEQAEAPSAWASGDRTGSCARLYYNSRLVPSAIGRPSCMRIVRRADPPFVATAGSQRAGGDPEALHGVRPRARVRRHPEALPPAEVTTACAVRQDVEEAAELRQIAQYASSPRPRRARAVRGDWSPGPGPGPGAVLPFALSDSI